jgi:sulfate transport system permease protein
MPSARRRVLPGFGLSLGYTLFYLSLLVLIPLAACFLKASSLAPAQFWAAVWTERARAAYALTFGAAFVAALVNALLGLLVAWVLVRYEFPGRRLLDALVDLPFALPTAVAGLVYANLYVPGGWLGRFLVPLGIEAAHTRLAVVLVLVFTGFPFVVRTVQPVLEGLDADVEEAALILGATRWQTFCRVLLPAVWPAVLTGFTLAFARALGGVRFGHFRLRQHAVPHRDRPGADRRPAGGVRLRRGDHPGRRAAGGGVRAAGPDQPAGTLEQGRW